MATTDPTKIRRTVSMMTTSGIFTTPAGCLEALPSLDVSRETGSTGCFGDDLQTSYLNSIAKLEPLVYKFLDEGNTPPDASKNEVVPVKIETIYSWGKQASALKRTIEYLGLVSKVTQDSIQVNGQRVAAWAVEITPVGGGDKVDYGTVTSAGAAT